MRAMPTARRNVLIFALLATTLASTRAAAGTASTLTVENADIRIAIDVGSGLTLTSIRDKVTNHEYLSNPTSLFEYAVNSGTPGQSNQGVYVVSASETASNTAHITLHGANDPLRFDLTLSASSTEPAATIDMRVTNEGNAPVFLRTVFPKITGLIAPGDWSQNTGVVPQEMGVIAPLHLAPAAASVATVVRHGVPGDPSGFAQEDAFVIGNDGALWTQFERDDNAWSAPIRLPRSSLAPAGGAIAAVRRNAQQEDVFVIADDGAVWTAYEVGDGAFQTVRLWDGAPIQAPPGGGIAAVLRNDHQEDVFFAANDGAIWTSFEGNNGRFTQPIALTPPGVTTPGAHIAALMRNGSQEDLFYVGTDGAIRTIFQVNDSAWSAPIAVGGPNRAPAGASIAAVVRNAHQEDIFVAGVDRAIWSAFELNDGPWSPPFAITSHAPVSPGAGLAALRRNDHQEDVFFVGNNGAVFTIFEASDGPWSAPISISPAGLAPLGAPVAAVVRNARQEDVFVVGYAGEVVTLFEANDSAFIGPIPLPPPDPIGKRFNIDVGLPTSMNAMELASIYDPAGGGGLFFADVGGDLEQDVAPIQFTLSAIETTGFWIDTLPAGGTVSLPTLGIGVHHDGDWHHAVDYYVRNSRAAKEPYVANPPWFREAGAIYVATGAGAGSIYLEPELAGAFLPAHIDSNFENLINLLNEARALGSNVVYLNDWWDGGSIPNPYLNKGDYVPRNDYGGRQALIDGIFDIHRSGLGRVVLYVEPFIIHRNSAIANQPSACPLLGLVAEPATPSIGYCWAAYHPLTKLLYGFHSDEPGGYGDNFAMVAPYEPWQDYLAATAARLVRDLGADGVFLDSWSWQMNWPIFNPDTAGGLYSPKQDSQGVLALADRVGQAMQAERADAVALGETTSGPIAKHWQGGLAAEFAPSFAPAEYIVGRLVGSPVRYGSPRVNYFSNGRNLNELHQVFAAGHSLALCCNSPADGGNFIHDNAREIGALVSLRRLYKDALIYGTQRYQPRSDKPAVVAYSYRGQRNRVLTVVNTSVGAYDGVIELDPEDAVFPWLDLTTDEQRRADGSRRLQIHLPAEGLAVLQAAASLPNAQLVVDGDFSTWTFDATGTATVTREGSGGNSGARLNVTTVSGAVVYGTAIESDFSTNVPLAGVPFTLSLDVRSGPGAFGQGQGIQLVVEQNGTIYGTSLGATSFPHSIFDPITFSGTLNPGSFTRLVGDGSSTPQFDGTVVTRFGFAAGNASSGTLTQYYDNFVFELMTSSHPGRVSALLTRDVTATDLTVPVDDISHFPDRGTIQVDDEVMTYDGRQATPRDARQSVALVQPGELLNVQRAANGTTPTPHLLAAPVTLLTPACVGDCHDDGAVTVDELLTMVNIALGSADPTTCLAGDANADGQITVDEIIRGVNDALNNCPLPTPPPISG
jgi:hypothetical protein